MRRWRDREITQVYVGMTTVTTSFLGEGSKSVNYRRKCKDERGGQREKGM
jgi:hypothetical protein